MQSQPVVLVPLLNALLAASSQDLSASGSTVPFALTALIAAFAACTWHPMTAAVSFAVLTATLFSHLAVALSSGTFALKPPTVELSSPKGVLPAQYTVPLWPSTTNVSPAPVRLSRHGAAGQPCTLLSKASAALFSHASSAASSPFPSARFM